MSQSQDPHTVVAGLLAESKALLWQAEAVQLNYEVTRTLAETTGVDRDILAEARRLLAERNAREVS